MTLRHNTCLLLMVCCWFIYSCNHADTLDWKKVISKYSQKKEDSLYLQSALFLQTNMQRQLIEQQVYYNQQTARVENIRPDTMSSDTSWLYMIDKHQLTIQRTQVADTAVLVNELIENEIEDAVNTWTQLPKNARCNFPLFLEYVLPYKIFHAYSPNWRPKARLRFAGMVETIQRDDSFAIHILDTINGTVKKWFVFDAHQSPATWQQLLAFKRGDCVALSRLMCFSARAYGLPVAIDLCPVWANINASNHYWNVLLQTGKTALPFMGGEGNPGNYNPLLLFENRLSRGNITTYKKCAKIFRHTFSAPTKTIRTWVPDDLDIPYTLDEEHVIDVTSEYYRVINIVIETPAYTTQKVAYLCVYNSGQWIPTAWDTINQHQQAVFTNMATEQLYMPAFFADGFVIPWQYPFIADSSGIHYLQPSKSNRIGLTIHFLSSIEQEQLDAYQYVNTMSWKAFEARQYALAAGKTRAAVTNGKSYTLYYWDNGWVLCSTVKGANACAVFTDVPANGLYKIVTAGSNSKERVFTYNNGQQQWW